MRAALEGELLDLFVRLAGIASPTGAEREIADTVTQYAGISVSASARTTAPRSRAAAAAISCSASRGVGRRRP